MDTYPAEWMCVCNCVFVSVFVFVQVYRLCNLCFNEFLLGEELPHVENPQKAPR